MTLLRQIRLSSRLFSVFNTGRLLSSLVLVVVLGCLSLETFGQRKRPPLNETTTPLDGGIKYNPNRELQDRNKIKRPDQLLSTAEGLYHSANYTEANQFIDRYLQQLAREPQARVEAGRLLKGKILFRLGKLEEAEKSCSQIIFSSATEATRRQARFNLSVIAVAKREHERALRLLCEVIGAPFSPMDKLKSKAYLHLKLITSLYPKRAQLATLFEDMRLKNPEVAAHFLFEAASLSLPHHDSLTQKLSASLLTHLQSAQGLTPMMKKNLLALSDKLRLSTPDSLHLYPMLAITPHDLDVFDADASDYRRLGIHILEGMLYARDTYNLHPEHRHAHLMVYHLNESLDSVRFTAALDSIRTEKQISLIVGPIFSDKARLIATHLSGTETTLITPTATDESLARLHPHFFQINPTHRMRGSIIAEYLIRRERVETAVIFAQDSTYSRDMAEGFRDKLLEQKKHVRFFGLLSPKFTTLKKTIEPLGIKFEEETGYAETLVDAIYLPMTTLESAGIAISQLKVFNFKGKLVGSGDWNNPAKLPLYRELIDSAFFAVDSDISSSIPVVKSVEEVYKSYYRLGLSPMFWRGFDVIDYTSRVFSAEYTGRTVYMILKELSPYRAVHTEIFFDHGTVNKRMNIMRFVKGNVMRLN